MESEAADSLFDELMSRGARSDRNRDETLLIGETPYLFNLDEFSILVERIQAATSLKDAYEKLKVPDAGPDHDYDIVAIGGSRYRFSFADFAWLANEVRSLGGDGESAPAEEEAAESGEDGGERATAESGDEPEAEENGEAGDAPADDAESDGEEK